MLARILADDFSSPLHIFISSRSILPVLAYVCVNVLLDGYVLHQSRRLRISSLIGRKSTCKISIHSIEYQLDGCASLVQWQDIKETMVVDIQFVARDCLPATLFSQALRSKARSVSILHRSPQ